MKWLLIGLEVLSMIATIHWARTHGDQINAVLGALLLPMVTGR